MALSAAPMGAERALAPWLARWRLKPDGAAFTTEWGSHLAPVVAPDGTAAMLKLAGGAEERRGGALMVWWAGDGAARVLRRSGAALLMERACGGRSLLAMAADGRDDQAIAILCDVAARLHRPRSAAPPATLVPLQRWFRALERQAPRRGGVFERALETWRALAANPAGPPTVLHGDIHHGNVLDGGAERGWLAIDPKGLLGERGFDYANMLCNPWLADPPTPSRLESRLAVLAARSGLPPRRILEWLLAWAGLSACWTLGGGGDAAPAIAMAERAHALLGLQGGASPSRVAVRVRGTSNKAGKMSA